MAKLKDEFDFENDNFGFEDFGDDSLGGFQDNEKPAKRRPFKKLAGAFVGGVKDSFLSRDTHREMIKGSLPAGYTYMYDAADQTTTSVKGLYDTARAGAGDVTKEIKRGVPGVLPGLPLPKGMKDKLMNWSSSGQQSRQQDVNMEDAELSMVMADVFGRMSKGGAEPSPAYGDNRNGPTAMDAANTSASILSDIADKIQGNSNIAILQGIKVGIDRLTSYQDQVTISYQRKSLELQHRQYFVARKSLDVMLQHLELSRASYDKLIVNTSLPDIVKTENSELAHQMLKQKFLGSVIENVGGRFGNVGNRIVTKAKTQVKQFFRDMGASVQEGMFTAGQLSEGMSEEGGMDKTSLAGSIAGGAAGKLLAKKLAKFIKEKTKDNPKIAALGLAGGNFLASGGDILQQLIKDDTGNGLIEMLKWSGFFDEFGFTRNDTLRTDATMHMDKVAQWDQRSKVALEEVIPGYLQSIDAHVRAIHSGGEVDPMEYSYKTGKFENSRSVKAAIHKSLAGDDKLRGTALALNALIKKIDPEKTLSDGAVRALKSYIFDQKKDGRNPDFAGLSDGSVVLSNDPTINMEIENAVTANMLGGEKYNGDGSMFSKMNHTFRRDVAQQSRMKDFLDESRNLESEIGGQNNADYLQHVKNGSTKHLVDLGLAEYDKDGSTLRRKFDTFRDGAIGLGGSLPDPDDVQGPPPPPLGPDGKPIKPKTPAQLALEEKAKEKAKAKKEAAEQSKLARAIAEAAAQLNAGVNDAAQSDLVQGAKNKIKGGASSIVTRVKRVKVGSQTIGERVADAASAVDRTVFNGSDTNSTPGEQHHTGGIVGGKGARHRSLMMGAFNGVAKYHTGGVAGNLPDILVVEGRKPGSFLTTAPNGRVVEWIDNALVGKRKVTAEDIEAAKARIAKKHSAKYGKSYKDRSEKVSGLKPNEVPTVLERGEEVLTAHDPRHRNNLGKKLGFKKENSKGTLESIYMATQTMIELLTLLNEKDLGGWMPSTDLAKWKSKIRGGYDSVKGFVPAGLKDARAKLGKGYDATMNQIRTRRTQLMSKMKGMDWDGIQASASMGYEFVKDGAKKGASILRTKGGSLLSSAKGHGSDALSTAKMLGLQAKYFGMPKLKAGLAGAKEHAGGLFGYMKMRAHLTKSAIKDKFSASGVRDIVIEGSSKPVITKAQLESGQLFDNQTGNVVHSLEDITGMVTDHSGKEILSPEDFNKGLRYASKRDQVRHATSTKVNGIKGFLKGKLNTPHVDTGGKGIMGRFNGLKARITGKLGGFKGRVTGFLKGFLKTGSFSQAVVSAEASTITDELSGIRAIFGAISKIGILLEGRLPAKPKGKPFWDRDGDGTRDGSERKKGLMERIKDKLSGKGSEEKDKKDKKEGGGLISSLFGNKLLLGAAGSAIGAYLMNKFVGDGEASVGKTVAGAVAGGVGTLMAGKMLWNGTKWVAKGAGKLAWGATKMAGRGLLGAGRFALMRAAPALLGAAGSALGGLATAAAAVITAPVALVALAAAVVIGGGYLIYKHYKNKKNPVARLRMAQYGFNLNDEKHGKAICDLETDLLKNVRVSKGGPATIGAGRKAEEYFKMFGVDPTKPEQVTKWLQWYQYRFKPVFLSHVTVLHRTTGKKDLSQADELMGRSEKVKYLGDVHYKNGKHSPYTVMVSPFGDEDKVKFDVDDVNSAYKTAVSNAEDEKEKPKTKAANAAAIKAQTATKPKVVTKTAPKVVPTKKEGVVANAWESMKLFASGGLKPALENLATNDQQKALANRMANSTIGRAISSVWSGSESFATGGKASDHEARLIRAAVKYGITDPVEIEMFLAQCAHESGNFRYLKELGRDAYFAKYDGRKDLGNTQAGDGARFKGRGYIQVTGRHNYAAFAKGTGIDVINNPGLIDNNPELAAEISAYWWTKISRQDIRAKAAAGDVVGTTKRVNGGTNGLAERQKYFAMYSAKFGKKSAADMLKATGVPGADKEIKKLATATPVTKPGTGASDKKVIADGKTPVGTPIKPGSGPISAAVKPNASMSPTKTAPTGSSAGSGAATPTAAYATGVSTPTGGKGGKVNLDAMCNWLGNNAGSNSKGVCAKYVRLALEAGGANTAGHPVSAKDYGSTLIKNGFQPLPRMDYAPQKGDVAVFEAHGKSVHGHICVYDGSRWVSDFKQQTMNPYKGSPNVPFTVYRHGAAAGATGTVGNSPVVDKTAKSAAMMDKHSNIVGGRAPSTAKAKPAASSTGGTNAAPASTQQSVEQINQEASRNRNVDSFSAAASSNAKILQDTLNVQIRQLNVLEKMSKTLDGMSKNGGLVNQSRNSQGAQGSSSPSASSDSGNSSSFRPRGQEPDYKAPVGMGLMT